MSVSRVPRVTVVIATYNWSAVLPYSIGSVIDQTFTDFELLVIGDGCTDDSAEVVARVGDGRTHWHNLSTNAGHQAAANNAGIRLARGDLIAYLGHDDLWLPHHLETLVAAADRGAEIAHGMTLMVPSVGRPEIEPGQGWVYAPGDYVAPTALLHARWVAEAVGGWRHPRDAGHLEPEMHLLKLMSALARGPELERRLTNVKLPAATRRAIYRTRPAHEQAYWLDRIRTAPEPESSLRQACHEPYALGAELHGAVAVRRTLGLPLRRARRALRRLGLPPTITSAERRWRQRRRYKGVQPP